MVGADFVSLGQIFKEKSVIGKSQWGHTFSAIFFSFKPASYKGYSIYHAKIPCRTVLSIYVLSIFRTNIFIAWSETESLVLRGNYLKLRSPMHNAHCTAQSGNSLQLFTKLKTVCSTSLSIYVIYKGIYPSPQI